MGQINQNGNAAMNTLKPQPGQTNSYDPRFHPLPGQWAQEQIEKQSYNNNDNESSSRSSKGQTPLQKALAAERAQHSYWEKEQGVKPGKEVYANPRAMQDTLAPTAEYGTEGR